MGPRALGVRLPLLPLAEAWPSWQGSALLPRRRPPLAGSSPAASVSFRRGRVGKTRDCYSRERRFEPCRRSSHAPVVEMAMTPGPQPGSCGFEPRRAAKPSGGEGRLGRSPSGVGGASPRRFVDDQAPVSMAALAQPPHHPRRPLASPSHPPPLPLPATRFASGGREGAREAGNGCVVLAAGAARGMAAASRLALGFSRGSAGARSVPRASGGSREGKGRSGRRAGPPKLGSDAPRARRLGPWPRASALRTCSSPDALSACAQPRH